MLELALVKVILLKIIRFLCMLIMLVNFLILIRVWNILNAKH